MPLPSLPINWTVWVGSSPIPWRRIAVTFEQFHVPAQFSITAPVASLGIPLFPLQLAITDKPPLVTVLANGIPFFTGQADTSEVHYSVDDAPDGMLTIDGRDLSCRLILHKILAPLPPNQTASTIVTTYCAQAGIVPLQIFPTAGFVGDFAGIYYKHTYSSQSLHDIIFDLAEANDFVFRVDPHGFAYFGPQPPPTGFRSWLYKKDFTEVTFRKAHNNSDVKVWILGWTKGTRQRIKQFAGTGTLNVKKFVGETDVLQARNMANNLLRSIERGLQTVSLTNVPGDPLINDVTFGFALLGVSGLSNPLGPDLGYFPHRIEHVITRGESEGEATHIMNLDLYNNPLIIA